MKAPRCQYCGVEEWGHLCVGRAPSEIERRAARGVVRALVKVREAEAGVSEKARGVTKTPVTKTSDVTETTPVTKTRKGGRPKKEGALSTAERVRRHRAALRALRAAEGK